MWSLARVLMRAADVMIRRERVVVVGEKTFIERTRRGDKSEMQRGTRDGVVRREAKSTQASRRSSIYGALVVHRYLP